MTVSLSQAQQYARYKKTKVISHRIHDDKETITFVLESGQKLTKTGEELNKEIATFEKALEREQAILEIDSQPKPAKETKPKPAKE